MSSADRAVPASSAVAAASGAVRAAFDVPARTRVAMVTLGFIPCFHLALAALPLVLAANGRIGWRWAWLSPVLLLIAPPLAVRASLLWRDLPSGRVAPGSAGFLHWWFTAQCQVLFARLPFIEELIRVVPGLYSVWLRLWGARIGSLVYWSPAVAILDRPLLSIGDRVIFGVGVRLNGHVLTREERGSAVLHIAPITIGSGVLVGGYSLLLPGCEVAEGEVTPPFRSMHAFSRYEGGRRS